MTVCCCARLGKKKIIWMNHAGHSKRRGHQCQAEITTCKSSRSIEFLPQISVVGFLLLLLLSSFAHIFCFISVILKNWIDLFGSIRNDIISLRYWIHEWNCESMCRTNKCAAVRLTYSRHKIKKEIYSEGVVDHSFVFLAKKIAYKTNRRDSPSRQLIVESTDGR